MSKNFHHSRLSVLRTQTAACLSSGPKQQSVWAAPDLHTENLLVHTENIIIHYYIKYYYILRLPHKKGDPPFKTCEREGLFTHFYAFLQDCFLRAVTNYNSIRADQNAQRTVGLSLEGSFFTNLYIYSTQIKLCCLLLQMRPSKQKLSLLMSVFLVHPHCQLIGLVYQGGDVVGHLHPLERPWASSSPHEPKQN